MATKTYTCVNSAMTVGKETYPIGKSFQLEEASARQLRAHGIMLVEGKPDETAQGMADAMAQHQAASTLAPPATEGAPAEPAKADKS